MFIFILRILVLFLILNILSSCTIKEKSNIHSIHPKIIEDSKSA